MAEMPLVLSSLSPSPSPSPTARPGQFHPEVGVVGLSGRGDSTEAVESVVTALEDLIERRPGRRGGRRLGRVDEKVEEW